MLGAEAKGAKAAAEDNVRRNGGATHACVVAATAKSIVVQGMIDNGIVLLYGDFFEE
jgi:hypothetical protein